MLRKILDMVPSTSGDVSWSQMASGISDVNSPLISTGRRVISSLFGSSEGTVTNAISRDSGLRSGVASTLMAMAAPMVMSYLGRRVRDEGMTMNGLGSLLQRESASIRSALPAGLSDLFWPAATTAGTAATVVGQTVEREKSAARWLVPLVLLALIPGLFWLFSHARRPMPVQVTTPVPTGTANRVATDLGEIARPKLPNRIDLHFDTGSVTLQPESRQQLDALAVAMAANPDVQARVEGYTDNVGRPARNLQLSQKRAKIVIAELVDKGVGANRLTGQGYGEQNPIADNGTSEGRAQNRHVAVVVIQPMNTRP
jgi:outer membrane protein OmpA-like peptidoglycan-associated protein